MAELDLGCVNLLRDQSASEQVLADIADGVLGWTFRSMDGPTGSRLRRRGNCPLIYPGLFKSVAINDARDSIFTGECLRANEGGFCFKITNGNRNVTHRSSGNSS